MTRKGQDHRDEAGRARSGEGPGHPPKLRLNRGRSWRNVRFSCGRFLGGHAVKIPAILVASLIALGSSPAWAEPLRPIFGGALPPAEVNSIVRSMGLMPTSRPIREGQTYAVLAADPRGRQRRVIVDARFGDRRGAARRLPRAADLRRRRAPNAVDGPGFPAPGADRPRGSVPGLSVGAAVAASCAWSRQARAEIGRGAGEPQCIRGDGRAVGRRARRGPQADRQHEGAELPADAIAGVKAIPRVVMPREFAGDDTKKKAPRRAGRSPQNLRSGVRQPWRPWRR